MQVNDVVKDLTGDFDTGVIIDIYVNRTGDVPVTMFVVDFSDDPEWDNLEPEEMDELDQRDLIFDRLANEIEVEKSS